MKWRKLKKCESCSRWLEITEFLKREDREGYYSWCFGCMKEKGRSGDYPPLRKRGGGTIDLGDKNE